jgi:eukaryotic-like serine/threonine-protein kinase
MTISSAEQRLGTILEGKYRLDRVLGEGGMGVVFAGMHLRLKRPIAVKFLHAHVAVSAEARLRFVREAEAAALLKHPNVVDVLDVGETDDGSAFMVLEFLRGKSLADHLEQVQRMTEIEVASILAPVIRAVGYAHANGIVHRDLKPDNIFLSEGPDGTVIPKVLDFGIAKLLDAGASTATQTGSVMGSPLYMSMEQAHGSKSVGPPSDVWSLGVILFQCLTGRLPWDFPAEPTLPMILVAIVTKPPSPVAHVDPSLTPELAAVVDRCTLPDASKRFANGTELAEAIEAIRPALRSALGPRASHVPTEPDFPGALGYMDTYLPDATQGAPPVATLEGAADRPASPVDPRPPVHEATTDSFSADARGNGLPAVPRPSTFGGTSASFRSMTRALWTITAVAVLALIGGAVALFTRSAPPTAEVPRLEPHVVVDAPPAPVVPVEVTPAAAPVTASAVAPVEPPPAAPVAEEPARATRRSRHPRTTPVEAAPAPAPAPSPVERVIRATDETKTVRRCANGVCSDLGGL